MPPLEIAQPPSPYLHRYAALTGLYFTQGVPYGFFTQALPVILRQEGATLTTIGLTSLLALPWGLKFLWAPLVDRFGVPGFERRLSWIVPLNLLAALTLLILAWQSRTSVDLATLEIAFFALNFAAATQDIATDSLAVTMFAPHERGPINGLQVAAYRIGMLMAGGILLGFHGSIGLSGIFAIMAGLLVAGMVPVLRLPRSAFTPVAAGLPLEVAPLTAPERDLAFLARAGAWRLIALLFLFKFGEHFASSMIRPYLSDNGATLADIGTMLGTYGFAGGLVGALVGGSWVNRIGRQRSLLTFGAIQSLGLVAYAALAAGVLDLRFAAFACFFEHLSSGMATAALFTCMMDWTSQRRSAFDYTFQACIVVAATAAASALGGVSAETLGYFSHFSFGVGLSLAGTLSVLGLFPRSSINAMVGFASPKERHRG